MGGEPVEKALFLEEELPPRTHLKTRMIPEDTTTESGNA